MSNRSGGKNKPQPIKGPAVSGAVAQNSQVMTTAALEAGFNSNLGFNSSQPIIIPSKGQHNLELNTNLRQVSKNRSLINDSMNNQPNQMTNPIHGSFTLENPTTFTDANTASLATSNGDRV